MRPQALDELARPRPSIRHLMLWTLCTAAMLGMQRHLWIGPYAAWFLVYAVATGPALAAILVMYPWRRQGYRFPGYPGEWFLVAIGCEEASSMAVSKVFETLAENGQLPALAGQVSFWTGFTLFVAFAALYSWAALCVNKQWRAALGAYAFSHFSIAASFLLFFFRTPSLLVVRATMHNVLDFGGGVWLVFPIIIAMAIDRVVGQRSPWTHWLGIGIVFTIRAATLVDRILRPNVI